MTRTPYPPPPPGFTPRQWDNLRAKRARELKTAIRAVYALDPILWAVIRGYNTDMAIMIKLDWTPERTAKAIHRSTKRGHIHPRAGRYYPTKEEHKALRKRFARSV